MSAPAGGTLVAGIGNVFLGDDGFGVEVVRRMARHALPSGVRVEDFGVRGVHLAYEIAGGADALTILVDAMPRGGPAGTLYVLEPDVVASDAPADAHAMHPLAVLQLVERLGGAPGRIVVVGCEPQSVEEEPMTLSEPVAGAVDEAVDLIRGMLRDGVPAAAAVAPGSGGA